MIVQYKLPPLPCNIKPGNQCQLECLAHFSFNSAPDLRKPYDKSESGTNLLMYDDYAAWTFRPSSLRATVTFWPNRNAHCKTFCPCDTLIIDLLYAIITSKYFFLRPKDFGCIITCYKMSIVFTWNGTFCQVLPYVFALKFSLIDAWMVFCD